MRSIVWKLCTDSLYRLRWIHVVLPPIIVRTVLPFLDERNVLTNTFLKHTYLLYFGD